MKREESAIEFLDTTGQSGARFTGPEGDAIYAVGPWHVADDGSATTPCVVPPGGGGGGGASGGGGGGGGDVDGGNP